jgi:hypothetical protein
VHTVARGEVNKAIEIDNPPMKAYSRADASGNVLFVK